MKTLLKGSVRAGSSFSPYQPASGPSRRPTAAPLRLHQQQSLPSLLVTQHSSAPTSGLNDLDSVEAGHRAAKTSPGSAGPWKPTDTLSQTKFLYEEFKKIQAEVNTYKEMSIVHEGQLAGVQKERDELKAQRDELELKLAGQQEANQQAVEAVKQEAATLRQQLDDTLAKLLLEQEAAKQALEAAREAAKLEAMAPLQQELDELVARYASQLEEKERAVEAARVEVAGPLQQQLEELAMQLQNSQAQLERLGEAVEAAEASKAATVQAMQAEKEELLLAMAGAARRVADIVYPAGTLPAGLTITTRLEGDVDMEALVAARRAEPAPPSPAPAAAAPEPVAASVSGSALQAPEGSLHGFGRAVAWVLGFLRFWLYHVMGALLLYYSAAILRGAPPTLNAEFGLGCLVVCTLLSWANRLFILRLAW